jgi:Putative zinc-finger
MRTKPCRDWRVSLGAYALGHLDEEERAGLEAHLEGCPECRAELTSLGGVAELLPHADPVHFDTAPEPSPELGRKVLAQIEAVSRRERIRSLRRRWSFGFGGIAAAAAAAALLAFVILPGGSGGEGPAPQQQVQFAALPPGVEIGAMLEPHAFGTEIHVYVSGVRSGTLCRVFLRDENGMRYSAGSFRYRWGDDSEAVLSSGLDLSRTAAIGVRAGNETFVAPVDSQATAFTNQREGSAT